MDEQEIEVNSDQMLCKPRDAVHKFENRGDKDPRALCVITPAEYFREVRDVVAAAAGGPPCSGCVPRRPVRLSLQ